MTTCKNIIFIINSPFPYYAGGIETWLYNVSTRLCADNNVTIISEAKTFYREPMFLLDDRIKVINYQTLHSSSFFRKIIRGRLRILNFFGVTNKIEKILIQMTDNGDKYYVISLTTLYAATAVKKVKSKRQNVRFICSARGPHAEIMSNKYPTLSKYFFTTEKSNLEYADLSLSNGYDTIEYFKKQGIETSLMKNGLDVKKFNTISSAPTEYEMLENYFKIVSVATLLDIKGIREIIAAVGLLVKQGCLNVRLILIGKGDQDKYIELSRSLGIEKNVIFLGHKSNVIPYLHYADAICCLSGGAGLSMSALEAMASRKPVIAWDTPVYQQFNKNTQTMVMVENQNIDSLAEKIKQIMLNPTTCRRMTLNAHQEAHRYDWSEIVKDLITYLNQLR